VDSSACAQLFCVVPAYVAGRKYALLYDISCYVTVRICMVTVAGDRITEIGEFVLFIALTVGAISSLVL